MNQPTTHRFGDPMILRGEALVATFTINFTLSGDEDRWKVAVDANGVLPLEKETADNPYLLLQAMIAAAFAACCKRFPERAPVHMMGRKAC